MTVQARRRRASARAITPHWASRLAPWRARGRRVSAVLAGELDEPARGALARSVRSMTRRS
jgi:hypothetical protein